MRRAFSVSEGEELKFKLMLDKVTRLACFGKRHPAAIFAEGLERFQGILFNACPHALLRDEVQVDKYLSPQQPIYFVFPFRISQHQPFQRCGLGPRNDTREDSEISQDART